jgi:hypothetical protein
MVRRTIIAAAIAVLVLVVAIAIGIRSSRHPDRAAKTWIVEDGQYQTFSPLDLVPDDSFGCSDGGGGVEGVPRPGTGVGSSQGISVTTELNGIVTVKCDPGPPGNL